MEQTIIADKNIECIQKVEQSQNLSKPMESDELLKEAREYLDELSIQLTSTLPENNLTLLEAAKRQVKDISLSDVLIVLVKGLS